MEHHLRSHCYAKSPTRPYEGIYQQCSMEKLQRDIMNELLLRTLTSRRTCCGVMYTIRSFGIATRVAHIKPWKLFRFGANTVKEVSRV